MLSEKIEKFHKDFDALAYVYEVIKITKPLKSEIEKACEKLKTIIDGGTLVSVDEEIKVAILSVYKILRTASSGLSDESVSALFDAAKEGQMEYTDVIDADIVYSIKKEDI